MDVMTAVLSRRSETHLVEPAPSDQEFAYLLRAAADAPGHDGLRPWRLILVRDEGRAALGETGTAPLLAALVFQPVSDDVGPDGPVPEWEQLAATSAMASSLTLLLHARGFGSVWRAGRFTESARIRRVLGLRREERLLGWLCIGTAPRSSASRRRVPEDVTDRISLFTP